MSFSAKQQEYFLKATKRWNVKAGATRSGKTYMDYYVIPKRIRATTGTGLIAIIGNTESTIERNILDPMRQIWSEKLVGNIRANNKIELFGKEVYVLGADKRNAVTKLQGAGFEYVYGDEITTWSEPVFQMLKSRLDKPNSVFDGTCNPDNPNHWFKKFLDSDADIFLQHYELDDNPFLNKFFVEQLKKEYTGVYYDRYVRGLWTRAEGLIYDMFNKELHVVQTIKRPYTEYYIAIDYGTQNATVFLLFGKANNQWYLVDEYYHSGRATGRQKTDSQYASDLELFTADIRDKLQMVVADPSAASFRAELKQRGFVIRNANNDVLNGIRYSQTALKMGWILINDICNHTIGEIQGYSWDEKKADLGMDAPLEVEDHTMDAFRYFCYTILRRFLMVR